MRPIRETLRLHLQAGLSYSEVGLALKISKSVTGKYVSLARTPDVVSFGSLPRPLAEADRPSRIRLKVFEICSNEGVSPAA
ncbi:hypothetical protein QN397_19710 [Variovorax sp. RTB1]|uniref:hypothetical protein n=1 Tax=Variovorax sp. RTB1 TaxID=3048631 RepID=UPI002B22E8B3|nr:hypothetical protein [Variovorax sp. RTB1]MEB0113538.1 hypothetical protein [Variovorax sp. RTB1]